MIHLGRRVQSWLAFATICFFVAGPQTSEAVPTLLQYTYVYETSTSDYIELTFSEPVTYGSMPSSLTFNLQRTDSRFPNSPTTPTQQLTAPAISPSAGIYSKYLKIGFSSGSAEYDNIHYSSSYVLNTVTYTITQSFLSITITALVLSPDGFANAGNTAVSPALTISYNSAPAPPAPTLTEFDYDVSLGQISLTFSTNVRFASFDPSSLTLTNNSGMSIPVVAVSSSPVPATSYNTVQLILPVQTAVAIATSPWIGANVSLLYLNITSTAITNYIETPLVAMPAQQVTNLKRDCYNTSMYYNSTIGNCQPCDPGCLTCAGPLPFPDSVSGCTNCSVVITSGPSSYQCVRGTSCPDGYYQNTTNTSPITTPGSILCLPCNSSCFTCTNGTQCTSCVELLLATPTQCCANMTGGPTCMACNDSCNGGCRGPLNTDCVYCRELNYTLNGTTYCLSSCPPHTYPEEGLCLKCTSNVSEVLCPPYACWLGFGYNPDTYVCELTRQFRFIVIPATCGGGGLLVITCLIICALCWHLPNASPSSRDKHAYVNPAYKPESKSSENPLLK